MKKKTNSRYARIRELWEEYRTGKMYGNTWSIMEQAWLYQTTRMDKHTCKSILMSNNPSTIDDAELRLVKRPKQGSYKWIEMVDPPAWFERFEAGGIDGFPWLDD